MTEPRRILIYWNSGLVVKTLTGRDERGVAQLEEFQLREGEFGPGVEFIEAKPVAELLERWLDYDMGLEGSIGLLLTDTQALLARLRGTDD